MACRFLKIFAIGLAAVIVTSSLSPSKAQGTDHPVATRTPGQHSFSPSATSIDDLIGRRSQAILEAMSLIKKHEARSWRQLSWNDREDIQDAIELLGRLRASDATPMLVANLDFRNARLRHAARLLSWRDGHLQDRR